MRWTRARRASAALGLAWAAAGASAGDLKPPGPSVGPSEVLGPLVGPGATPVPDDLLLYGTDLGWTFEHQGEIQILFGDSWIVSNSLCLGEPANDDAAGTLPPAPPPLGVPDISFRTKPGFPNQFDPIQIRRGVESLPMGYGRVPLTGWSDGAEAGAIFGRSELVRCEQRGPKGRLSCKAPRSGAGEPRVGPRGRSLVCAEDVGACAPAGVVPCDLATGAGCGLGQACEPTDTGFCIDEASSQIAGPADRRFAIAHANDLGIRRSGAPPVHDSVAIWRTNKLSNATARSVVRFTGRSEGSDYAPGPGALLVWGRPGFTGEEGRQAQLYLAVLELPLRKSPAARARFRPRYFAGLRKNGEPRWSRSEAKAAPLALDGMAGGSPLEAQPQVLQMGIGWVGPPLGKWVMLYGGDLPNYLLADPANANPGPSPGAVRLRFADHPWGPWSVARAVLSPGDPAEVGDPYGPGGVLFHPDCVDQGADLCAESDPTRPPHILNPGCVPFPIEFDVGGFYGSNLIDAYTEPDGKGGVDIYWNVSTWNPYGVLLVRTNLRL